MNSTEMVKEATLETIGYICQEIESEVLVTQSNQILTAIIHGMKSSNTSNHVRLAATRALFNSLEFTKGNFEIEVRILQLLTRLFLPLSVHSLITKFITAISYSFLLSRLKEILSWRLYAKLRSPRTHKSGLRRYNAL